MVEEPTAQPMRGAPPQQAQPVPTAEEQ
jgi:hypothetical protein